MGLIACEDELPKDTEGPKSTQASVEHPDASIETPAVTNSKKSIIDPETGEKFEYFYSLPNVDGANFVDQCGASTDYVDVELFQGKNNIPANFVDDHADKTVQIRWDGYRDIISDMGTPTNGMTASAGTVPTAKWCTGTFITEDLVITAGHCFDPGGPGLPGWKDGRHVTPHFLNSEGRVESYVQPLEIAQMMFVKLRYQLDLDELDDDGNPIINDEGEEFQITELIEHRNSGLDYAIVRVATNGTTHAIATVRETDLSVADEIAIIQHPLGKAKQIDAGAISSFKGVRMYYNNLDTHGGSSGAGVLDASGDIRAIHFGGHCSFFPFPGNVATRIESLIAASPQLNRIAIPLEDDEE